MDLIYLDYNCFQRSFDDSQQIKIHLEALACEEIFIMTERKQLNLVWSFMHEDENALCPFGERRMEASRLSFLCKETINPNKEIYTLAKRFQQEVKLSSKDAIHLACAYYARCEYFLTCDDRLRKRGKRLNLELKILNPVDYIREVDTK